MTWLERLAILSPLAQGRGSKLSCLFGRGGVGESLLAQRCTQGAPTIALDFPLEGSISGLSVGSVNVLADLPV